MAEGIGESEPHGSRGALLHAGDIGDGRDVVIVEAVAEAKDGAGEQREFERCIHSSCQRTKVLL